MANLKARAQQLAAEMKQQVSDEKNRTISERSKTASEYVSEILGEIVNPNQWSEAADVEDVRREWGVADGVALSVNVGGVELLYVQGTSGRSKRNEEPRPIPSLWTRTTNGPVKIDEMGDLARAVEKIN